MGFETKYYRSINLNWAVTQQHGARFAQVATGTHLWNWAAFDIMEPQYFVLPVLQIASDLFQHNLDVEKGKARFKSALESAQNWYRSQMGRSFFLLAPLIQYTTLTAEAWNQLSHATQQAGRRYDLMKQSIAVLRGELPDNSKLKFCVTQFTGDSEHVWLGAANQGNVSVVPPRACSVVCDPTFNSLTTTQSDTIYAIAHELGHSFGLAHPSERGYPNYSQSIMQGMKPPQAVLLPEEKQILMNNPFFLVEV